MAWFEKLTCLFVTEFLALSPIPFLVAPLVTFLLNFSSESRDGHRNRQIKDNLQPHFKAVNDSQCHGGLVFDHMKLHGTLSAGYDETLMDPHSL